MLKKISLIVLIGVLIIFCSTLVLYAKPTDRKVATEFCEVAMSRADRLKYSGLDYGIDPAIPFVFPDYSGKTISVSTSVGTIYVYPDDLTISEAYMILTKPEDTEEESSTRLIKCALAISALEFSLAEDDIYEITKGQYGSESPTEKAFAILNENASYSTFVEAEETGEDILIYSGNYDYYVRSYNSERYQAIELYAKERE